MYKFQDALHNQYWLHVASFLKVWIIALDSGQKFGLLIATAITVSTVTTPVHLPSTKKSESFYAISSAFGCLIQEDWD